MKILVPLNNKQYILPFIEAGAEEFYAGFFDSVWFEKFGRTSDINRMSNFKTRANLYTLGELMEMSSIIKQNNASLYVTMNAPHYTGEQVEIVHDYMRKISKSNIDGVIVSTPEMVMIANSYGINAICSTMCAVYNQDILSFYQSIGAKKIIFPRDVTLNEIRCMTSQYPHLEYEVFLMRNGCIFSDSHCLGYHMEPYGSLCKCLQNSPVSIHTTHHDFAFNQDCRTNTILFTKAYRKFACGQCAIYDLLNIGITSCKIVGRADSPESVLTDIKLTRKNIEIAQSVSSKKAYLETMSFPSYMAYACNLGYSCYYPEVRFGEQEHN